MSNQDNVEGMAKFGITANKILGISIADLKELAKEIGINHELALKLYDADIRETKILASYIENPKLVTEQQLEKWALEFESWDEVDQVTGLFEKTKFAYAKAVEWSSRKGEFVKRAAFTLIARLSVHDEKAGDEVFIKFLPIIKRESTDERNYVKKAVSWALRSIGKRNPKLNKITVEVAQEIKKLNSSTAQWIADDALKELKGARVKIRLKKPA